jgi:hypothetical protein
VIAAAPQAAPPTISASRELAAPIVPMIVAPIGVLPTNAVDQRAVIRPRAKARSRSWMRYSSDSLRTSRSLSRVRAVWLSVPSISSMW